MPIVGTSRATYYGDKERDSITFWRLFISYYYRYYY